MQAAELSPTPPNISVLLPHSSVLVSSRNTAQDFAVHSLCASRKSRLAVWYHFLFHPPSRGRCPGASSSECWTTSDALSSTVAPLSLHLPAATRTRNGPMLNSPAAYRGKCPRLPCMEAWGTFYSAHAFPFDQIRAPSANVLCGVLGTAAPRTTFLNISHLPKRDILW